MKHFDWKKVLPYVVAIVLFVIVAVVYCAPILDGKELQAGDVISWKGNAHEALEFCDQHGYSPWWTGNVFSGMPTYQITGKMPSSSFYRFVQAVERLGFGGVAEPIGIIFSFFFGFFLMLRCFDVNPWLAIAGAFAIGLSSYFFLIIPAGHISKACAIGSMAPVIGGIYATYRKRYWLGIPLVLLYGFIGVTLHPQMTYYIFMLIGVMICAELYIHIREKRWKDLGISTALLIVALLLVLGSRASWYAMNTEYLGETMRGGHSDLTQTDQSAKKQSGLDIDYATAWSYGIDETATLLVPNFEGGASGYDLGKNSQLEKELKHIGVPGSQARQFCSSAPTYHGEKAFTSGPVYVGAVVCFLFILGLLIVPGPYKWALLIATLFSFVLAWGRNLMPVTEFFYNYFPMYSKFRAVESILIVAEITIPLLGMMALQTIYEGKIEWKKLRLNLFVAGGITALCCIIIALMSGSMDMTSSYDAQWKSQVGDRIYQAILDQRATMVKTDAWRSLLFVVLGFGLTFFYAWKRKDGEVNKGISISVAMALVVLILVDMIPVDRRFFNYKHFVRPQETEAYFKMQPYEEQILQDKTLDFRTLNLASNTFNDARTSYRLKSIGGYSATKLRRYQDLIDAHISKELNPLMQTIMHTNGFVVPDPNEGKAFPVLNMLNMRYAVVPLQGGNVVPVKNPYAMGNSWFVDSVLLVSTADEESEALNNIDLHHIAVADEKFADALNITQPEQSTMMAFDEDKITLKSYQPNELIYDAQTERNKIAVFSEIYYPHGWKLTIDGQEAPIARVNYMLRAAVIPAGQHTIVMHFKPEALSIDKWCYVVIVLLLIISITGLTWPIWKGYVKKGSITA